MGTEIQNVTFKYARDFADGIKQDGTRLAFKLKEARDGKHWQVLGYESWKDYGKKEFGFEEKHTYRLLKFAEVSINLDCPTGQPPTTERQVRPLAHLPPEQQKEVWAKAVEIGGGKPTAKDVQKAVVVVVAPEKPKAAERPPKFTPDFGWDIWVVAKNKLEQIAPNDLSRERALNDALNYINDRIQNNR